MRDTVYVLHPASGEALRTTSDHPFFVHGRWVRVRQLRVGDSLRTQAGQRLVLRRIEVKPERVTVFNFTVDGLHTYFVGSNAILVHNSGPCPIGGNHGNSLGSNKTQHGYRIINKNSGEVMEYGISGQKLSANGSSPRVAQKHRTKYGNNPNYIGEVMQPEIKAGAGQIARQNALDWEQGKVNSYSLSPQGPRTGPPNQVRPQPNR